MAFNTFNILGLKNIRNNNKNIYFILKSQIKYFEKAIKSKCSIKNVL